MIARRLWGLATALGLLVMVAFGFWACLNASVDQAGASKSALVALGAVVLVVVGIRARGQGRAAVAKVRQVIGALGLFLTPVFAALTLLALADPPLIPRFLLLTVLALLAWMQGIAAQSGLSFRVLTQWFATLAVVAALAIVVGGFVAVTLVGVLGTIGLDADQGTRVAFGLVVASMAAVTFVWAKGRRDRQTLGRAVVRAAFGRARTGDIALLAAGPGPILRGRSMTEVEVADSDTGDADRDARLAAIDAALADASRPDRKASSSDP
jgi:hypothetical protein